MVPESHTTNRIPGGVWLTSVGVVALLLATSARYGFHRDELYFLVAGRRLGWGFVDQPPLTPFLAHLSESIGGTSPTAVRVLPAIAIGIVVLIAASMARRFGGGKTAQIFAAIAAGGSGVALAVGHLLSTATFDYLLWTVAAWLVVRLLDGADPREWLWLGLVIGIGLENKYLIGLLAVGLLISIVISSQRRLLAGPWPWMGAALAALIALPNVLWQAGNGWPQLEMARVLADRSDGPVAFVLQQFALLSIALAVPAAAGWWRLVRSSELRRWRPIAITFGVLFVFFLATGGKAYYIASLYPVLLAAGAGWFEQLRRPSRRVMAVTAAAGILAGTLIALPLLPPSSMSTLDATGELGETVGWPEFVDQIAAVYESIPASVRSETVIFTGSYGEAGAIDVLGPARSLPRAYSGHNHYGLWGPPDSQGPIIAVGYVDDVVKLVCSNAEQVGTVANPYGVENEEAGLPIYLCLNPDRGLAEVWDSVRHLS